MADARMMLLPAARGTCAMCATEHDEGAPHNYWSVFYQMRFQAKYGREATHADVIAHLTAEYRTRGYPEGAVANMPELRQNFRQLKGIYQAALKENGQCWNEPPEGQEPIPEPYAEST